MGYLDRQTGTLLSGDTLQLFGISRYRNGIRYPRLYRETVERIRQMPLLRIIASHEYDPLGACAEGRDAIEEYLNTCLQACPADDPER
jgi:glyoxylase-like metal-dependent hydrolase (beta-lactamase superfamily II)